MSRSDNNSNSWSKDITESEDGDIKQKRWEGVLCLVIALVFITLLVSRSLVSSVIGHVLLPAGLSLLLGLLLTIGKQCVKSADDPQTGLKTLLARGLVNYAKVLAALFIVLVIILTVSKFFRAAV